MICAASHNTATHQRNQPYQWFCSYDRTGPPFSLQPPMSTSSLTPQISKIIEPNRWKLFVQNDELKSYSFYLPHNDNVESSQCSSSAFSSSQLDGWFRQLHPSSYNGEPTGHGWTEASYKGKTLLRQTAWCVFDDECTCEYGYSDTWQPLVQSKGMRAVLRSITDAVSNIVGLNHGNLNCVNLNYYPRGGGVGFHADDEYLFDGINRETRIISLSLCSPPPKGTGATVSSSTVSDTSVDVRSSNWGARRFQVKRKGNKYADHVTEIVLRHGDLITMEGMFQKYYLHSVWPGDSMGRVDHPLCQGERINLTWRTIVRHLDGSSPCQGMTCPLSSTDEKAGSS